MNYVLIGLSAAAVNAAAAIRSVDRGSSLTLVSDEAYPPYARIFITNYLAGKARLEDMLIDGSDLDVRLGAAFKLGAKVAKVDAGRRAVVLESGECLPYDRLLLASGARPALPDFPGADLPGVGGLRTLADAVALLARVSACPGGRVVVLGGGLVSLKAAEALTTRGVKVTVVVASGQVLSQMADKAAAGMVQERMAAAGVELILNDDVSAACGGPAGVTGVELAGGRSLDCCALVVGKGVVPNVEFLAGTGVETGKGVRVDERGRTSVAGIWAAGDVAETKDVTGRWAVHAMWPNAVKQGRAAGLDMSGSEAACESSIRVNAGSFFGLNVASVGLTRAPAGAEEIITGPSAGHYRKVILQDGVVAGVVLAGDVNGAGVWQSLVARAVPVAPLRAQLGKRSFGYQSILPHPWFEHTLPGTDRP